MNPVIVQLISWIVAILCAAIGAWGGGGDRENPPEPAVAAPRRKRIPKGFWTAMLAFGLALSVAMALYTSYSLQQQIKLQREHVERLEKLNFAADIAILALDPSGSGNPVSNDPREACWYREQTDFDRKGTMRSYRRRIKLQRTFSSAPTIVPTVWGKDANGPWYVAVEPIKGRETTEFDLVVYVYPTASKRFEFNWMYISWMAFETPNGPPPPWTPPPSPPRTQ